MAAPPPCKVPRVQVLAGTATVQVVDPGGRTLKVSMKGRNGLRPLAEVVVKGTVGKLDQKSAGKDDPDSIRMTPVKFPSPVPLGEGNSDFSLPRKSRIHQSHISRLVDPLEHRQHHWGLDLHNDIAMLNLRTDQP